MSAIPEARYLGPIPGTNFAPATGPRSLIGLTVHHIDGSIAAADSTFKSYGRGSSACYGVSFKGEIVYWLDPLWNFDYHACQAQWEGYIGIENESDPNNADGTLTDAQIDAIARIARFHGIPPVAITQRGQKGIGYHRQFGGVCSGFWGQTDCPGDGIQGQIPAIVAAIDGTPTNPEPETGDDDVIYQTEDNGQKAWYREARGYLVPIDPAMAYAHVLAGVRVVPLGGFLAALAFDAHTRDGLTKLADLPGGAP